VEAEEERKPVVPWTRPELFLPLPPGAGPWGVVRAGKEKGVTLEQVADLDELRRRVREDRSIHFAWGPGDRNIRPVTEIDELAPEIEARAAVDARNELKKSLPSLLLTLAGIAGAIVYWPKEPEKQFLVVLLIFFVGLPLWRRGVEVAFEAWRSGRRLKRDPAGWRATESSRIRFATWSAHGRSIVAIVLIGAFAVTLLAMRWTGRDAAVDEFGLVKKNVRAGEWWRLISCAFLHANVVHLFFNSAAGWSLARIARSLVSEVHILATFLLAAVAGSVASTLAGPVTSLGASGGILGWGGLLLGLAVMHKELRPTGLIGNLTRWVVLLALIGVAGMSFIDNAAHAGGFVAGFAVGVWIARDRNRPLPVRLPLSRAGWTAVAVLLGAPWLWMLWLLAHIGR